ARRADRAGRVRAPPQGEPDLGQAAPRRRRGPRGDVRMTAGVSSTEPPGTVVTPPREDTDRDSRTRRDEPWRVIVLNDDHNTFEGVAFVLSRVIPDVSYEQGLRIADRIHNSGRAVV